MGTSVLVSEHEYLTTSYEPDCEYDNGELLERHVGERTHGLIQRELLVFLYGLRKALAIDCFLEQRIRVSPRQYRLPDVCVYREPAPRDAVFSTPPFIVIEVISPEDRMSRVRKKIDEYLAFGVSYVWIIDPETRCADVYTPSQIYEVKDGILRSANPAIEVPLTRLFQVLDA